jgi:hypothetical protein
MEVRQQPDDRPDASQDVPPEEFLRALMHISSEDAKNARERSPATRRKRAPRPHKPDDEPRD